jgi:hypothetical protein
MNSLRFPRQILLLVLAACSFSGAAAAPEAIASGPPKIVLEPSAASLRGGKARLTTTALRREAGRYNGTYQLKVFPYAFKNETGTLSIGVSDELMHKLSAGSAVSFTGTARTTRTGRTRPVTVLATPAGPGVPRGKVTISITTENGALVFAPGYTLTGN